MNDRELLELAAKAAGIVGEYCEEKRCFSSYMEPGWNPLNDDGDALRLSVHLQLEVSVFRDHVTVFHPKGWCDELYKDNATSLSATRLAIVRAAAEIGKNYV